MPQSPHPEPSSPYPKTNDQQTNDQMNEDAACLFEMESTRSVPREPCLPDVKAAFAFRPMRLHETFSSPSS